MPSFDNLCRPVLVCQVSVSSKIRKCCQSGGDVGFSSRFSCDRVLDLYYDRPETSPECPTPGGSLELAIAEAPPGAPNEGSLLLAVKHLLEARGGVLPATPRATSLPVRLFAGLPKVVELPTLAALR
jgi:hypothetical protein